MTKKPTTMTSEKSARLYERAFLKLIPNNWKTKNKQLKVIIIIIISSSILYARIYDYALRLCCITLINNTTLFTHARAAKNELYSEANPLLARTWFSFSRMMSSAFHKS